MTGAVEQVGGSHYGAQQHGYQHWDLMEAWQIDYLTATGTKYVTRWETKGTPELDLGKALSYFEKVLSCRPSSRHRNGSRLIAANLIPEAAMPLFFSHNPMGLIEQRIMLAVLCDGTENAYHLAIGWTRGLLEAYRRDHAEG